MSLKFFFCKEPYLMVKRNVTASERLLDFHAWQCSKLITFSKISDKEIDRYTLFCISHFSLNNKSYHLATVQSSWCLK